MSQTRSDAALTYYFRKSSRRAKISCCPSGARARWNAISERVLARAARRSPPPPLSAPPSAALRTSSGRAPTCITPIQGGGTRSLKRVQALVLYGTATRYMAKITS